VKHRWMRACITIGAVAVAAVHVVWPALAIDGITALLLLVGVVPWLQPLFKSLELPGGVKVEFQEIATLEKRADDAGLLAPPGAVATQPSYSFQLVAGTDQTLALAGLRIELERRLDALARANGYEGGARGIGNLLRHLNSRELISGAERGVLSDLVSLLNSAVHGAQVSTDATERALEIGPRILEALKKRAASENVHYLGIADGTEGPPAA